MLALETDTIAAIATPPGEGGISVIRISGEAAFTIADRGFKGGVMVGRVSSHTAHYGSFVDSGGEPIDNVVALVFRKPQSYTGEDTVELSCHGGLHVTRKILEAIIGYGARAAQPGEFTKRAFLNGRMDLAQAEAVGDLIHARSERARQSSLAQLNGQLSAKLAALRDQLIRSIGLLELELDFAEDGYEFAEKQKIAELIRGSIAEIESLLSTYRVGRVYREGVRVVLAGAPNVGKSSLLNALLKEDRAIVTDIPGTTRDIIEESASFEGLLFRITDTAGLRITSDPIELEGVRRAEEKLLRCDILVLIIDCARPPNDIEAAWLRRVSNAVKENGGERLVAINKIDLGDTDIDQFDNIKEILSTHKVLKVSAKTLTGLESMKETLVSTALGGGLSTTESAVVITSARHYSALRRCHQSLELALESITTERSGEFIVVDLRAALDAVGEIVGTVTTDDILNSIFSTFCIGK